MQCRRTFSKSWEGWATQPALNPAPIRTMLPPRSRPKPPEAWPRNQRRTTEAEFAPVLGTNFMHDFAWRVGQAEIAALKFVVSLVSVRPRQPALQAPIKFLYLRHVLT